MPETGSLGLSGTYLAIAEDVEVFGKSVHIIRDWDGENDGTHIISADYRLIDGNDFEVIAKISRDEAQFCHTDTIAHPNLRADCCRKKVSPFSEALGNVELKSI